MARANVTMNARLPITPALPWRSSVGLSAVGECAQCPAKLWAAECVERPGSVHEETAANGLEIVEGGRAVSRQTLTRAECHLRGNLPDGSSDGSHLDPGENGYGLAAGDHQDGSALVFGLRPPDLALAGHDHQGSFAIILRVASSAQPTSPSV